MRSRAVLHINVAEMNVSSVGGAKYFVIFIENASGHISTYHLRMKEEAVKFLKRCLEHQADCRVKEIVFNGQKEYITEIEDHRPDKSEVHIAASSSS